METILGGIGLAAGYIVYYLKLYGLEALTIGLAFAILLQWYVMFKGKGF